MKNKKPLFLIILLVTYVLIISFPTYLVVKDDLEVRYIVEIILRGSYLIFIILFSIFTKMAKAYTGKTRYWYMLLLLPLFFVAFFNLFYKGVITGSSVGSLIDNVREVFYSDGVNTYQILRFVCIILTVAEEEILFRYIVQRNLSLGHKIVRILVTAAIFAGCHFFTLLFDGAGKVDSMQLLTIPFLFAVGVIIGILYEYTNNIYYSLAFSLIFFLCYFLFPITLITETTYKLYLTASLFLIGSAAYLILFFFVFLKKDQR